MGDWIFTTLAWLLLAIGVLGLAWALLWDRSRGRRRCPRCWYIVDGVPERDGATTCPECGKVVRKARRLRKTRRRWGFALLAVLVLLGSLVSSMYPSVRDHGWHPIFARSPDIVLIALVPWTKHFNYNDWSFSYEGNYLEPHLWRRLVGTQEDAPELASWRTGRLNMLEAWLLRRTAPKFLENPGYERHPFLAVDLMVAAHRGHLAELPKGREIEAVACMAGYAYVSAERFQGGGVIEYTWSDPFVIKFTVVREHGGVMRHDEAVVDIGALSAVPNAVYFWGAPKEIDPTDWHVQDEAVSDILYPKDATLSLRLLIGESDPFVYDFNTYAGVEPYRGRPCHVLHYVDDEGKLRAAAWIDTETNFILREHEFGYRDARYLLPDTGPLPDTDWATDPAASPLPGKLDAIEALMDDDGELP